MAFSETKIKDVDWKQMENDAAKLSKEELITFILKRSARGKRELEKKIGVETREVKTVDSYVDFLDEVSKSAFHIGGDDSELNEDQKRRKEQGTKYFQANEGRKKQIKVLEKDIVDLNKKLGNLKEPKQECEGKKKEAQNLITVKKIKSCYKYFEKNSDGVTVALFEIFIGCLRNVEKATKEDVELYLKNHKGLITSMNKLEESSINRNNAKAYADVLKKIKEPIVEKEYSRFIPFYVWMDNIIRIVKYSIDEKHLREELNQKENTIFKLNHEIERANIVLDHLGIDPYQYDHFIDIIDFWNAHNRELETAEDKHKENVVNWNDLHVQSLIKKKKNEEEKKIDQKREYPIYDEKKVEDYDPRIAKNHKSGDKNGEVKTKAAAKSKVAQLPDEESKQDDSADDESGSEENDNSESGDDEEPESSEEQSSTQ